MKTLKELIQTVKDLDNNATPKPWNCSRDLSKFEVWVEENALINICTLGSDNDEHDDK